MSYEDFFERATRIQERPGGPRSVPTDPNAGTLRRLVHCLPMP
jgi:hypothetical protein